MKFKKPSIEELTTDEILELKKTDPEEYYYLLWIEINKWMKWLVDYHLLLSDGMLDQEEIEYAQILAIEIVLNKWDPKKGKVVTFFYLVMKCKVVDRLRYYKFIACKECNPDKEYWVQQSCIDCKNGWQQSKKPSTSEEPPNEIFVDLWQQHESGVASRRPFEIDPEWLAKQDKGKAEVIQEVKTRFTPQRLVVWWLYALDVHSGKHPIEDWKLPEDLKLEPQILEDLPKKSGAAVYKMWRDANEVIDQILREFGYEVDRRKNSDSNETGEENHE